MHRLICCAEKNEEIDHINRNKLDNRKSNLRIVAHWENSHNRSKGNGVRKPKGRNKWCAQIYVNNKRIYLGSFGTKEEAMNARINAEKTLLPTVMTQGLKVSDRNGKTVFMPPELLPTPMGTDIHHGKRVRELKAAGVDTIHSRANGASRPNGLMDYLDFHGLLPTPKAQESRGNASVDRGRSNLTDEIARIYSPGGGASQLNPLYVGDMMGFPVDWTVSPFLGGGRSR